MRGLNKNDNAFSFSTLRQEALKLLPNFSKINELPVHKETNKESIKTSFVSEKIEIKDIDYYFSNSISRASKTMSECRQINKVQKKTGTNN